MSKLRVPPAVWVIFAIMGTAVLWGQALWDLEEDQIWVLGCMACAVSGYAGRCAYEWAVRAESVRTRRCEPGWGSRRDSMKTVCIESPLAGDFVRNIAYARAALRYCLEQGVSPYASHLLLPQVYDDLTPAEREAGIAASHAMGDQCDERWFFVDLGWSSGMERAKASMFSAGQHMEPIELGADWKTRYPATPTPGF